MRTDLVSLVYLDLGKLLKDVVLLVQISHNCEQIKYHWLRFNVAVSKFKICH